ncbi:hypothetical protein QAD02_009626 [Eretmocerus hayati]|uniref:Uncharacterized protein n=1 Tax=Eretmocerus hayati TaxID=131215 RepID=A0ACC2NAK3_9HYME|nr:hypothetical protein QAD02_009626 [Eretmocerus hayati]
MFYIQPPKGLVTFHNLEEIISSRLEYLHKLENNKHESFHGRYEHLLEGSPHDCVGHFVLRFITSRSTEYFSSWLDQEALLLSKRLSLSQPQQLYKSFRTAVRHLKRRENYLNPAENTFLKLISYYLNPQVFKHITLKHHSQDCCEFNYEIDFELLPDLIENRSVELNRGLAIVTCAQWKEVLISFFKTFIRYEMEEVSSAVLKNFFADPRINSIRRKMQGQTSSKDLSCGNITASNIDDEVLNFPPCMAHLHFELRQKHRLSHYARFYYTLFLKECGMSLEEALHYWRQEYSKPHLCTSLCTHDWNKDSKKFTYSIRHAYGLEGGRKNYKTPNCRAICDQIPGANYEGGCPFNSFDMDSLKSILCKSMTKNELDQFIVHIANQKPQDACARFLRYKSNTYCSDITISKPVQYYRTMIEPDLCSDKELSNRSSVT